MATQNDTLLANYDEWAKRMIGTTYVDSIGATVKTSQQKAIDAVMASFSTYSITNEMLGEILSNLAIQTAVEFNKDAINAAVSAIKEDTSLSKTDSDILVNTARESLLNRQEKGFDDNLFVKTTEFQSNLASFAVNAGSDTAQTSIDDLKTKMATLEATAV